LVSLPLFQFLLFRLYYRPVYAGHASSGNIFEINSIWLPAHPDRSAALDSFPCSFAFIPLLLAQEHCWLNDCESRKSLHMAHLTHVQSWTLAAVVFCDVAIVLAPCSCFAATERPKRRCVTRIRKATSVHGARSLTAVAAWWLRSGTMLDPAGDISHSGYVQ